MPINHLLVAVFFALAPSFLQARPWMDKTKTPEERARLLTAAMTLEEKADQLSIHFVNEPELAAFYTNRLAQGRNFGAIMWIDNARQARALQETALRTTRLKIPYLFEMDVTHGFATGFPVALGTATSWDEDLVERCETVAGREAAAAGFHLTYAPMCDISDDPRWGRICETSGEDPYLSAKINAARVRGFQKSVTACPKHFVAYSALRAGRDYHAGDCSLRELEETHLAPYREMMRFGLDAIMCAYTPFDGLDLTENDYLCREVLRNRLGFRGQLMTDWQTIRSMERYGISTNAVESACRAMNAGIDVDMRSDIYADALPGLVKSGRVAESRLNEACARVLALKFKRGLFDDPFAVGCDEAAERAELRKPENLAVAREAVRKGVVLLENRDGVLPVSTEVEIAVVGPLADSADDLCGDWPTSYPDKFGVTPIAGFREAWGAKLVSVDRAGTVLYCCGEKRIWGGEHHSRLNPVVPAEQVAEMRALKAKGKRVVAIVFSARPLVLTDVRETADAILFAFFPGIEGGHGLADLVCGAANPSGHLVNSFPHAVGQIPLSYRERRAWSYDEWVDGSTRPLYPFGYGLSYTTYSVSKPVQEGDRVSAVVKNTGSRAGVATVQLYLRRELASVVQRERELTGFRQVALAPGESKTVSFVLGFEELKLYNAAHKWVDESGPVTAFVGFDAATTNGVTFTRSAPGGLRSCAAALQRRPLVGDDAMAKPSPSGWTYAKYRR